MAAVEFVDNRIKVKAAMMQACEQILLEAAAEVQSAAQRNSRVNTGQLKGSWQFEIRELSAQIGSPLQNAIWEEFGTGEYAAQGNGRKGGWRYQDTNGDWHFTKGKSANHTLQKAFNACRNRIIKRAEQIIKDKMDKG